MKKPYLLLSLFAALFITGCAVAPQPLEAFPQSLDCPGCVCECATPSPTVTPSVTSTPPPTPTPPTPTPTPIPPDPPPDSDNLLVNGDFEQGFEMVDVNADRHQVGKGWRPFYCDLHYTPRRCPAPFQGEGNPAGLNMRRPEYKPATKVHQGVVAQQWFCYSGTCDAGIYQTIATTPGQVCTVGAYVQSWANHDDDPESDIDSADEKNNTWFYIAVDVEGDTFAFSDQLLRSRYFNHSDGIYDQWVEVRYEFVAQSSETTVFFGAVRNWPIPNNDNYLDDAYVKCEISAVVNEVFVVDVNQLNVRNAPAGTRIATIQKGEAYPFVKRGLWKALYGTTYEWCQIELEPFEEAWTACTFGHIAAEQPDTPVAAQNAGNPPLSASGLTSGVRPHGVMENTSGDEPLIYLCEQPPSNPLVDCWQSSLPIRRNAAVLVSEFGGRVPQWARLYGGLWFQACGMTFYEALALNSQFGRGASELPLMEVFENLWRAGRLPSGAIVECAYGD